MPGAGSPSNRCSFSFHSLVALRWRNWVGLEKYQLRWLIGSLLGSLTVYIHFHEWNIHTSSMATIIMFGIWLSSFFFLVPGWFALWNYQFSNLHHTALGCANRLQQHATSTDIILRMRNWSTLVKLAVTAEIPDYEAMTSLAVFLDDLGNNKLGDGVIKRVAGFFKFCPDSRLQLVR